MKTKNINVLYSTRSRQCRGLWAESSYIETPKISMEGKWLETLGFHIGDRLQIDYEEGSIHIRPAAPMPAMVCESKTGYTPVPCSNSQKQ